MEEKWPPIIIFHKKNKKIRPSTSTISTESETRSYEFLGVQRSKLSKDEAKADAAQTTAPAAV